MKWLDCDAVRTPHLTLCLSQKEFLRVAKHCNVSDPGLWLDETRNKAVVHTDVPPDLSSRDTWSPIQTTGDWT